MNNNEELKYTQSEWDILAKSVKTISGRNVYLKNKCLELHKLNVKLGKELETLKNNKSLGVVINTNDLTQNSKFAGGCFQ